MTKYNKNDEMPPKGLFEDFAKVRDLLMELPANGSPPKTLLVKEAFLLHRQRGGTLTFIQPAQGAEYLLFLSP